MDHGCVLMNSFVDRFLQDNGAPLRNTATGAPTSISAATRIASPSPSRLPTYSSMSSSTRRTDRGQQTESRNLRQSEHQHQGSSLPTSSRSTNLQAAYFYRPSNHGLSSGTMSSNFNALFRPSTPPPNEYGRFRNTSQSGLTFEFWDDDDDAALPADSDALDNEFLDFLENEFSSPSTYPSFTYPSQNPPAAGSRSHQLPQTPAPGPGSAPFPSSTAPRNQNNPSVAAASGACILHASAPERSETQLTTSTTTTTVGESQNTLFGIDNIDDLEYDDLFDTPASSFDENMPPSLRRRPEVATPPVDSVHRSKRRRTSTNAATPNLRKAPSSRAYATKIKIDDDDCIFEDKHSRATPGLESKTEDLTTIDLTEANEVPEELKKPEVDNRIKISAFQCVICMDDCTTLSVTHCGHMYCAQCLHSSLNVEATKGKCPMCRQKLELKPRETYTTKTKGFWPLELKLMTATRKGKRKANSMA